MRQHRRERLPERQRSQVNTSPAAVVTATPAAMAAMPSGELVAMPLSSRLTAVGAMCHSPKTALLPIAAVVGIVPRRNTARSTPRNTNSSKRAVPNGILTSIAVVSAAP